MSYISSGNTTTTAFKVGADTTGNLVFATGGANATALTLTNTQTTILAGPLQYADGTTSNTASSSIAGAVNVTLQQGYGGF